MAKGDPLAPQGFNPVERRTIYPGDPLSVTCVFDSSGVDHPVQAGPTHDHEMCNMYLMVYSTLPHIEMCNDGAGMVSDAQPGNLPTSGVALLDPYPGWRPPRPADKAGGDKVRARARTGRWEGLWGAGPRWCPCLCRLGCWPPAPSLAGPCPTLSLALPLPDPAPLGPRACWAT
jgi:hypothetical protein